jgi:ankyrin repeat protein
MEVFFPRLGQLLRTLVTGSGYRSLLVAAGLGKDLDDLAIEARPGSQCGLMQAVEKAWIEAVGKDCGIEWQQAIQFMWQQTRGAVQHAVLSVDSSALGGNGYELVAGSFSDPLLCSLARLAARAVSGPDMDNWWLRPFRSWVAHAAKSAGIAEEALLDNLANFLEADGRSISRWQSGEPIGLLAPPYSAAVLAAIGKKAAAHASAKDTGRMAGWLMATVALQSHPAELRAKWNSEYRRQRYQTWSLEAVCAKLAQTTAVEGRRPARGEAVLLLHKAEALFAVKPLDEAALDATLLEFDKLIRTESDEWQRSYRYIHDWFCGRLEAMRGNEEAALAFYTTAVEGAWWRAGPNQHPLLNEALLYAVGIGKKAAAEHYWDKVHLLGLNRWPKRPLDCQELRRLSFGFENMFAPLMAKERVPPSIEVILREEPFALNREHLANPNRKAKFAEGRTRRTPFMEAIRDGTLDDVRQMLEAGGNLDDYIPESGEGPLTYAMRRACDRKDPAIMRYLLEHEMTPETVNRSASTKRETPLKIAVEMADAEAVSRLATLGADPEAPCNSMPSALCYAMALLYESINRNSMELQQAYLAGKVPGDAYDAKEGAVLDADLAARRQRLAALRHASERNEALFRAVMEYMLRSPHEHKNVIATLLKCGADPNRRYKVEAGHLAEWTPTLFAAQVGDAEVFKMLVSYGGDPDTQLMPSSSMERYDALWVAVNHKKNSVVEFLMQRVSVNLPEKFNLP